jgi:Co/Zn/Cd efflux system component
MAGHCCAPAAAASRARDPRYRRILWIALLVNAAMFVVELVGGIHASSSAVLADAIDFFGDAANYGVSLAVLSLGVRWRATAALLKGVCMAAFGSFVLINTGFTAWAGTVPEAATMGVIGLLALCANLSVAALLYAYRTGDANMRSVWLCTRNDAIGNVAVMAAALAVFNTGGGWPDWLVAALMGSLALSAGTSVVRQARAELKMASA